MGSEDSTNEDVVNFFTARWSKKFQSRPDCVFTKALALMKSYQIDGEMLFSTSSLQNLETKLTGTYQISPAPAESIALHIFRMKGDQLLEHLESASREQAKFGILLFSFSTQKALQQDLEAKGYPDAASIADQVFRWKDPRCGDPSMQEDFIAALQRRFKGEFFPDRDVCPAIILQERYPFGQSVCREKEFDKIFQFWHSLLTDRRGWWRASLLSVRSSSARIRQNSSPLHSGLARVSSFFPCEWGRRHQCPDQGVSRKA